MLDTEIPASLLPPFLHFGMNICDSAYENGCVVNGMCSTAEIHNFSSHFMLVYSVGSKRDWDGVVHNVCMVHKDKHG